MVVGSSIADLICSMAALTPQLVVITIHNVWLRGNRMRYRYRYIYIYPHTHPHPHVYVQTYIRLITVSRFVRIYTTERDMALACTKSLKEFLVGETVGDRLGSAGACILICLVIQRVTVQKCGGDL